MPTAISATAHAEAHKAERAVTCNPEALTTSLHRLPRQAIDGWQTVSGLRDGHRKRDSGAGETLQRFDSHDNLLWTRSGQHAIGMALALLGIGPGDRVLVPTCHCPTMIAPVVRLGAAPVFYPLAADGSPNIDTVCNLIDPSVRVMLAANYFGIPVPLTSTRRLCELHGIVLIEDCAHAFFHAPLAPLAIASLPKFFAVPDGGCLRVNDASVFANSARRHDTSNPITRKDELRAAVHAVQAAIAPRDAKGSRRAAHMLNTLGTATHVIRAWCHRPVRTRATTSSNATLPANATSLIARWLTQHSDDARIASLRRRNFNHYLYRFRDKPGFAPLFNTLPPGCVPYVFPLLLADAQPCYARLRRVGAPVWRWDRTWPDTPSFMHDTGARWSTDVLQMACHQDLELDAINAIADAVLTNEELR